MIDEVKAPLDFNDPEFNTYLRDQKNIKDPTVCRNCHEINSLESTFFVKPAYRYCRPCYMKMKEINQIVPDPEHHDGKMVMLWQGDPFHRGTHPVDRMFGPGYRVPSKNS